MNLMLLCNADVFAPEPLGLRNLLLGGGRVLWMGDETLDLPDILGTTLATIDLEGRRLLPGLIDCHVHATGGGGEAGFRSRVPGVPLSRFTLAGISTVVGLLGTDDIARSPQELLAAVYALREEGLNAYALAGGYHLPPRCITESVASDLVFIDALIGIGEIAISDHRSSQPELHELLRLASQAHVAGLMTGKAGILHLHLGDGVRGLDLVRRALAESELPARVFNPTHINRRRALFEEALDLARDGSVVDITAFPVADGEDAWSAADALIRYLDCDAPATNITVSSDAGGCLPAFDVHGHVCRMDIGSAGALLETLRELLSRGVPLPHALPAFTSNPARLLRLHGKGGVRPGADADLLVLGEAGAVWLMLVGGVVHVRDGVAVRRGMFEPARD